MAPVSESECYGFASWANPKGLSLLQPSRNWVARPWGAGGQGDGGMPGQRGTKAGSPAGALRTPAGPFGPYRTKAQGYGARDGAEIQRQCRSPRKRLWRAEHVGSVGASRGVDAALHPACSTGLAGSSFLASCGVCPGRLAPHKCLIHDDTAACSPSCQWEPGLCFP